MRFRATQLDYTLQFVPHFDWPIFQQSKNRLLCMRTFQSSCVSLFFYTGCFSISQICQFFSYLQMTTLYRNDYNEHQKSVLKQPGCPCMHTFLCYTLCYSSCCFGYFKLGSITYYRCCTERERENIRNVLNSDWLAVEDRKKK